MIKKLLMSARAEVTPPSSSNKQPPQQHHQHGGLLLLLSVVRSHINILTPAVGVAAATAAAPLLRKMKLSLLLSELMLLHPDIYA